MRVRYRPAAFLLLLLLAAPVDAATREAFSSGPWKGEVLLSDSTGAFRGCLISTAEGGDTSYGFALFLNGHLGLLVQNTEWTLPKGRKYRVTLAVDRERVGRFQARALRGNVVHLDLGAWEEAPVRVLRRGKRLTLASDAAESGFPLLLHGTDSALPRLQECYREHTNTHPFDQPEPSRDEIQVRASIHYAFR
ncbi:hypothetical protein AN478_04495 [Thiohalorhabdus denitrificans]|uniref:NADH:ubiquinone oxidoreductase intermediate-associated protein 30 domain-containing protein n=1 Tax=Thiohalorhabdus denitrificans TaxID=381306 RepID=A0A0P9ERM3_9GAMM|nr:hypothetical protein [Thiohalorhabdus denitrificans]KPV41160.1 hypothetical protein AN478_04495 [Thiohalorhabdus denitrificans]SCY36145.1 hypothetical protein SAMN05661077_1877 [Thiohalorhabdus denitrificans]